MEGKINPYLEWNRIPDEVLEIQKSLDSRVTRNWICFLEVHLAWTKGWNTESCPLAPPHSYEMSVGAADGGPLCDMCRQLSLAKCSTLFIPAAGSWCPCTNQGKMLPRWSGLKSDQRWISRTNPQAGDNMITSPPDLSQLVFSIFLYCIDILLWSSALWHRGYPACSTELPSPLGSSRHLVNHL